MFRIVVFLFFVVSARAETEQIQIGVLACLSGDCAEWGSNTVKGAELAAHQINSAGGINGKSLRLRIEDSGEGDSPAKAVAAFKRLTSVDQLKLFVGPSWTPAGLALAPIVAKRSDIIMTSPSLGVADFNEAGENLFNTWPHDSAATQYLAEHAIAEGFSRVAIFSSQQPWESTQAKAFGEAFTALGGEVVIQVEPLPDARDLAAEALKVVMSKPEAVFFANFGQMDLAAKEIRKLGYKGPKLAILMDDTRVTAADGALTGTTYVRYPEPAKTFVKDFVEYFGVQPGITADSAYDTVMLYAKALKRDHGGQSRLVTELVRVSLQGASGVIQFDQRGGIERKPQLFKVLNQL